MTPSNSTPALSAEELKLAIQKLDSQASQHRGHAVRISLNAYPSGGTKVEIDGMEIQEVATIKFEHYAQEPARLILEIFPKVIEMDGPLPADSLEIK